MAFPTQSRRLRGGMLLGCVLAAVVGLAAAEGFLRLLIPYSLFYSTWFEPGIHKPDRELGFVFTPHYRGGMRHRDRTWRVPLELDEYGMRMPVSTNGRPSDTDIVLLGGYSMIFSYGLATSETVAAQIAANSSTPVNVYTLAWPGFGLTSDFCKFRRFLADRVRPSVLVICLYKDHDYDMLHQPFQSAPREVTEDLFRYHDGIVLSSRGETAEWLGRSHFEWYLLAGVCRHVDRVATHIPFRTSKPHSQRIGDDVPREGTAADYLTHLQAYCAQRNTQLLIVALPRRGDVKNGPPNLETLLPSHIAQLDLRDALRTQVADWKAAAHYGPRSAHLLGREIAKAIQAKLDASSAIVSHAQPTAL